MGFLRFVVENMKGHAESEAQLFVGRSAYRGRVMTVHSFLRGVSLLELNKAGKAKWAAPQSSCAHTWLC